MTTADRIDHALRSHGEIIPQLTDCIAGSVPELRDGVIDAIHAMSHDELRQLRPDIATLYDATRDTANTRGDYILNHTAARLRAVEELHTQYGDQCRHCLYDWPCPTTRTLRGNP